MYAILLFTLKCTSLLHKCTTYAKNRLKPQLLIVVISMFCIPLCLGSGQFCINLTRKIKCMPPFIPPSRYCWEPKVATMDLGQFCITQTTQNQFGDFWGLCIGSLLHCIALPIPFCSLVYILYEIKYK